VIAVLQLRLQTLGGLSMKSIPVFVRNLLAASACAAFLAASGAALAQQKFINVLTGGQSGVYYPLGVALSQIYAKAIPDAKTSAQATKASVENLNLLQAGRGEVAFALGDALSDAWKGDEEAGFKTPLKKLRTIGGIYSNYIQIVASADSGIKTLADLKGKRISVGAAKSGTELNARAILKAAGLSYSDFSKVEYLPFGESVELMKNRQLDVTLQSAGLGVAAIRDLATAVKIVVVAVPPEVVAKVNDAAYLPATIPANTYTGQTADVKTVAIKNFLVTHEGVPTETVYLMTKSMFENLDQLSAAHNAAKAISKEDAPRGVPVPLHAGAEKYYREAGLLK
jgi:TRAP transporter TAXI family solute receptor